MNRLANFLRRVRRGQPIVVVSGLPRSGTSMMMQMLAAGGVPILSDDRRQPDENNPVGYLEFEPVKALASGQPPLWLDDARGRAVKIVSFLLTWLPETHDYQVIFMRRDLREVAASQHDMLASRGEDSGFDVDRTAEVYAKHLDEVGRFLAARRCFVAIDVDHQRVINDPAAEATRLATFLRRPLDTGAMTTVVDAALYRHRSRR